MFYCGVLQSKGKQKANLSPLLLQNNIPWQYDWELFPGYYCYDLFLYWHFIDTNSLLKIYILHIAQRNGNAPFAFRLVPCNPHYAIHWNLVDTFTGLFSSTMEASAVIESSWLLSPCINWTNEVTIEFKPYWGKEKKTLRGKRLKAIGLPTRYPLQKTIQHLHLSQNAFVSYLGQLTVFKHNIWSFSPGTV